MSKDSPSASVKGDSVTNSVIKIYELAGGIFEEIVALSESRGPILCRQDEKSVATEGNTPHSVTVIRNVEAVYQTLLEVRYVVRDISDRLAL